jgi:integrase
LRKHLGTIRLAKLRRPHIETFYSDLLAAGVSAAMVRKVGVTLSISLNAAVASRLIPYNPATGVRKPKAKKPEIQVLDLDQAARFLREARSDRLYALYVTALDSGCRPGELLALTWPDLDLTTGYVSLRRSLEDMDGKLRIKDVKTAKSRRRIKLAAQTLDALHEHRKAMLAEGRDVKTGILFVDTEGGYVRLSNLRPKSFQPILRRAGLPKIRLYDLRHTCATLLLLADVPAKIVSERLGHASITITLDTYSHVLPSMQERAAAMMSKILGYQTDQATG